MYTYPHITGGLFNSHPHEEDDTCRLRIFISLIFSTHILTRRMTVSMRSGRIGSAFSTHILTRRMTYVVAISQIEVIFSTHILTRRMTAILNKIFSFKIKLYIHYNILFAIFYIYNSILYPFSSQKYSYSGANDSANSCSLAFRTPRFPVPSLQIHFP